MNRFRGMSLIEILISFVLGSLLLSILIHHYLLQKRQFKSMNDFQEEILEMQLIYQLVKNGANHSGFTPCLSMNSLVGNKQNLQRNLKDIIHEKNNNLTFKYMSENYLVSNVIDGKTLNVQSKSLNLKPDMLLIIADCSHYEVAEIQSIRKLKEHFLVFLKNHLKFDYETPLFVGEFIVESFYIHIDQQGNSALYYQRDHPELLSSHVKKMQTSWQKKDEKFFLTLQLEFENDKSLLVETLLPNS